MSYLAGDRTLEPAKAVSWPTGGAKGGCSGAVSTASLFPPSFRWSILHAQDDFAAGMAACRSFPGVARLGKRKHLADDRLNAPRVDQIANRSEERRVGKEWRT